MLQILFKRGYIDSTKVIHPRSMSFSKMGKKIHYDATGQINSEEKNNDSIISFKDYVSNLNIKKFLRIFKNKKMLYESNNSLKADMIIFTDNR